MPALPTGTITFLLSDVEGSTRLWEQHPAAMRAALVQHDAIVESLTEQHHGHVVRPRGEGDSRFCVFARATDAVAAAAAVQVALHEQPWSIPTPLRVRMALHTGEADLREGDYYGSAVNRCARIRALAHGGQVLLSDVVADLARETLPNGLTVVDLGLQRLRGLTAPERVYQLTAPALPSSFPPLHSPDALPNNLPLQVTSFVGRETELTEVRALLGRSRLVTLTATGGAGKTRLALQVGAEVLEEFSDGVWFADLAPVADAALVPQIVAAALGLREAPGRPLLETLLDHARARRLLIVLDNCEHLIEASARVADALVRGCPRVHVLATSREALGIAGEVSWRVPSLPVPDPTRPPDGELAEYPAVRLFVERARAALPSFALTADNTPAVAQVCHRLDGIPLAIELAAARVKALAVEQISLRLDQRFRLLTGGNRTALPRQQTLAATVGWSYDLLSEPERQLFRRLAVFSGRFTLEAAERVGAVDGRDDGEVLDLLVHLVEKSLVVAEEGRGGDEWYRLLETLRQYGREHLAASGEAEAAQEAHATYYLDQAEQAAREIGGPRLRYWLARFTEEMGNLRLALRWSVDAGNPERALRLIGELGRLWYLRGYPAEMRGWLDEVLTSSATAGRTPARADALISASSLAWNQQDVDASVAYVEEALAIARELRDPVATQEALIWTGVSKMTIGDLSGSRAAFDEGFAIAQMLDQSTTPSAVHMEGQLLYHEGDYAAARSRQVEYLDLMRAAGHPQSIGTALNWIGHCEVALGEYAAAQAHYQQSLRERLTLPDYPVGVAFTLCGVANLAGALGQHARLVRLVAASTSICEQAGTPPERVQQAALPRYIPAARAALGEQRFQALWDEGKAKTLDEAVAYALSDQD